jgi:hypothetical protein
MTAVKVAERCAAAALEGPTADRVVVLTVWPCWVEKSSTAATPEYMHGSTGIMVINFCIPAQC